MNHAQIEGLIGQIPDFPTPGILFMDLLPIFKSAKDFQYLTSELIGYTKAIDAVVGIEARGLILGTAMAIKMEKGFVPLRKKGKLPGDLHSEKYGLEYGSDELEIQAGILKPGERVVLVDDVLATGGTLIAGINLLKKSGVVIESVIVALELTELGGRAKFEKVFPDLALHAYIVK